MTLKLDELEQISEETFLLLTASTLVKLKKKDSEGNKNLLGDVFKIETQRVVINRSYVEEVKKTLGDGEEFIPGERTLKYDKKVNSVIYRGDDRYLNCIVIKRGTPSYVVSGNVIEKSQFEQFIGATKHNPGDAPKVQTRLFKFDSIISVSIAD